MNLGKYLFLYVAKEEGERVLADLLLNIWNARRGTSKTQDSGL